MAKTVDNYSTIEDFRTKYNDLATDVGEASGLRTEKTATIVDAINSVEDKSFFFQEFIYLPTASTTFFTGVDDFSNTLSFRKDRIQVFQIDGGVSKHLLEDDDYTVGGLDVVTQLYSNITLTVAAQNGDRVVIYSYTGSYLGTLSGSGSIGFFDETGADTIYNTNNSGVILNGDGSNKTIALESGYTIQLAGKTYAADDITLAATKTLSAPTLTDGTAIITGGVGTVFSSITSTNFVGNLTGDVVGDVTGDVSGSSGTVTSITAHSVNSLSNVSGISTIAIDGSPANGQVLSYDGTNWVNSAAAITYTNEMAQDAVNTALQAGTHTNITVTYNDAANSISLANTNAADITGVTAGAGLTGGGTSGTVALNVIAGAGITANADNVVLDYETVSSAPANDGGTATGHLWFVI